MSDPIPVNGVRFCGVSTMNIRESASKAFAMGLVTPDAQ